MVSITEIPRRKYIAGNKQKFAEVLCADEGEGGKGMAKGRWKERGGLTPRIHLQVLNRSAGVPFERNLLPLFSMHDKILKHVRQPPRGF